MNHSGLILSGITLMPPKKPYKTDKPAADDLSVAELLVGLAKPSSPQGTLTPSIATATASVVKPPEFIKPEFTYHQLYSLFKRPFGSVSLPPLLPNPAAPSLPNELLSTIVLVETAAKRVVASKETSLSVISKTLLTFLETRMALVQWEQIAILVDQNLQAKERLAIQKYQGRAEQLLEGLYLRIKWFIGLSKNSRKQFNTEECLRVIAIDSGWVGNANTFMCDSQKDVILLKKKFEDLKSHHEVNKKPPTSPLLASAAAPAYK